MGGVSKDMYRTGRLVRLGSYHPEKGLNVSGGFMNRRDLLKLTIAGTALPIVWKWSETPPPKKVRAPVDTDDRKYDDWLDANKDLMHL